MLYYSYSKEPPNPILIFKDLYIMALRQRFRCYKGFNSCRLTALRASRLVAVQVAGLVVEGLKP